MKEAAVLSRPALAGPSERRFTLRLVRSVKRSGAYGLVVHESHAYDHSDRTCPPAATLGADSTRHILDRVIFAVVTSGYRSSVLATHRDEPIPLDEAAGVRLALTVLAVAHLRTLETIGRVAAGIANMSTEETYYWYSLCSGAQAITGRKALRVLLSEG